LARKNEEKTRRGEGRGGPKKGESGEKSAKKRGDFANTRRRALAFVVEIV
jgi:hypothetical protein